MEGKESDFEMILPDIKNERRRIRYSANILFKNLGSVNKFLQIIKQYEKLSPEVQYLLVFIMIFIFLFSK